LIVVQLSVMTSASGTASTSVPNCN
jgi:hypothetical protein